MSQIIKCDTCGRIVELGKLENRTLVLECDCPERRSIRVAQALPEGWL